jgi:methyl-accepting chemotaxis protein
MFGKLKIQTKLALGFAIGPLILLIVGAIIYWTTETLVDRQAWADHTYQVLTQIEAVKTRLVDAETGQRGYLITNDETYLEPYRGAATAANAGITRLAELTADNPRQQTRIATLRNSVQQKLDQLQEAIDTQRSKGKDAANSFIAAGLGKKLMDDIRSVMGEMEAEENDLLRQRSAEAHNAAALAFGTIIVGIATSFVLMGIVGFLTSRSITAPVGRAVETLASLSAEILAGTSQQAAGMREHSSAVTETVSTVDEVLQTSEQAAQRALAVSDSAQRASDVGQAGRKAVEDSVSAMAMVKDQTGSIAESILTLAEQGQAIGEIIASVNDIGEQINLLSLNAAIEASRAGEQGKGFNVVAAEIKALADQSKKATAQIRQILGEIQKATNSAVMVTEQGTKSVNDAIKTVNEAGATIRSLADVIAEAAQAAAQIAASSGQQATGMRQIHQAMQNIKQVSSQSLAATNQSEKAAQHLNELGGNLKQLMTG